jgi:hypothetical protein
MTQYTSFNNRGGDVFCVVGAEVIYNEFQMKPVSVSVVLGQFSSK